VKLQITEKPEDSPPLKTVVVVRQAAPRWPQALPPKPKPGTTLDGTWDRRLKSGAVEPDRVLDLHGMNLDRAWQAIDRGLERAISAGDRVLLLITGHHRPGDPPVERGRIRAAVHDWLAASRHAANIAAVRGAHRRHGGGGSLYIILRRR
jgi:DNA-nicking Smr family endonuclease